MVGKPDLQPVKLLVLLLTGPEVKNPPASAGNAGDTGLIPRSGRSSGGGNGNTPVFLPGKFHGQRSLAVYNPQGHKRVKHDLATKQDTHIFQFSCSVVYDSLPPHGVQHARLPCPSPTPGACSNSCSLSQWCQPTISSSVVHFSFCFQSFPASGSFPMSQFFTSGGQSIGLSASASVLPMNIQDWFPLGGTGWISLQSKGLSSFLQHHNSKASTHILLVCKEILSFWREMSQFLHKALKCLFPVWLSNSTVKNLF